MTGNQPGFRLPTAGDLEAIERLIEERSRYDGHPALTEYKMRALAGSVAGKGVVLCNGDGAEGEAGYVSGYVQAAWHERATGEANGHWALEVVLAPGLDDSQASQILSAARSALPPSESALVWSWNEGVVKALMAEGYQIVRKLVRMKMDLPCPLHPNWSQEMSVRPFERNRDEGAWLAVNGRAFADHPETLTRDELVSRMDLDWFTAADLLMAWHGTRLVGSCWTKVHPGQVGEIYIIGVDPSAQGKGLGRNLLLAGLDHLVRVRACQSAILYTDTTNQPARHLYGAVGFRVDLVNRLMKPPDSAQV